MLQRLKALRSVLICGSLALSACGPRAHIPPLARPAIAGVLAPDDSIALLARSLAPVLFVQRDEYFPLVRSVAVVHPTRRIIAYHLLWQDDVHGSWIPFTRATDQEIVWVGYDSTGAPTELWTYWHKKILHTTWADSGTVAIDVQWGKHGSLPRNVIESDLPGFGKMNSFYAFTWLGIWDMWLGRLTRRGPMCFCHGYGRYREFTRPIILGDRLDVIAQIEDPHPVLAAIFGDYSKKRPWP